MAAPPFPTPDERDDALSAWLDGELPTERRAQVDAWLQANPEEAARVRLWAADRDALRARLASAASEPVPDRLQQLVLQHAPEAATPWWRGRGQWAAALAVFALGGLIGAGAMWRVQPARMGATQAQAPAGSWVQRAALAHSVYVPEQRHPVEVAVAGKTAEESRAQEEHLSRWLTRRLNVPVKLFDLREQGYELVGGRLLPDGNGAGPGAQLMYQAAGGTARVTVYLRKPDEAAPAAFRFERDGDVNLFYWVEAGTGYALAGSLPREQLLALAEAIYRQQPAATPSAPSTPK
ncbi:MULTISPECIES: anti-sigma factor [unclassified Rhizobacter]|uniref:anti-sigma factor family protein n=1 Tax=unclassified Rhizobacter TaxID=2640088 RepID=UPI000A9A90F9|nr:MULTISPECIES: anti-sigma factor [unclassified Rhizobacter]